ncbi:unnamed protein product, partial [Rotaria sp. Silwood2]
FFYIFFKIKDLTTSKAFQEYDTNKDGFISPKKFRRAMEAQKVYSSQDIDYILDCVDINQDGKIDFLEFTERFHSSARDIGLNMGWNKSHIKESKKAFLHLVVNETDDKEKLEQFIKFFEDTIFEMHHAIAITDEEDDQIHRTVKSSTIEPNIFHKILWTNNKNYKILIKIRTAI